MQAQAQPGITRTDLQQHDLSFPGREAVQARVDLASGVAAPEHGHPGEEIVYVIEGVLEYQIEGEPPVTVKAGTTSGLPFSATYVASSAALPLPTFITAWIASAGMNTTSPATGAP